MMENWKPIISAALDEDTPVIVYFDHDADPYQDPSNKDRLTAYACHAEGGDFLTGKGVAIAVWRNGYHENDGWEAGDAYYMPGAWFAWFNGNASDEVVNAIYWMPVPSFPEPTA